MFERQRVLEYQRVLLSVSGRESIPEGVSHSNNTFRKYKHSSVRPQHAPNDTKHEINMRFCMDSPGKVVTAT